MGGLAVCANGVVSGLFCHDLVFEDARIYCPWIVLVFLYERDPFHDTCA